MVEKTHDNSAGTREIAPGGEEPGEKYIEASGDAIVIAEALLDVAAAIRQAATAIDRMAGAGEDEDDPLTGGTYLDGTKITVRK